jgi:aminopeptidase N
MTHRILLGFLTMAVVAACARAPVQSAPPPPTQSSTPTAPTTLPGDLAGVDAAPGIGDRLFPDLGNAGYDVQSYDLTLVFDRALTHVRGSAVIEAAATLPLRSFVVDLVGYTVDRVEVDGVVADHVRDERDMRITPARPIGMGETFRLGVEYRGSPAPVALSDFPFPTGWQRGDSGSAFLFSQPDGASGLFPANDHPVDRADVRLTVSLPEGLVAVSGGGAPVVEPDGDRVTFTFEIPRVAPYLVPLAIGSFEPVTSADGVVTWMGDGAPLPLGFDRQREILEFLETDLGPFPFDSIGSVVVSSGFGAALETQTLPTYTTASAAWGEPVIAHELAHQWIGNTIALAQWEDIWLNEGLATFMTWRWIEHDRGRDAYIGEVNRAYGLVGASVFVPVDEPPVSDLFGTAVYQRGGLTVAALREFVGDTEFFSFLRSYVTRFSDSTVTTETFLTFVLIVLGPDAERLVIDWLRSPELPPNPLG